MLDVFVPGIPAPAGSKRGFITRAAGKRDRVAITDDCKRTKPWQTQVALIVSNVWKSPPLDCALQVVCEFSMPRPQAHFMSQLRQHLKKSAPYWHTTRRRNDGLKLTRAVEDALTGIVWSDDSVICDSRAIKHYGHRPGVRIIVCELPDLRGDGE